MNQRAAQTDNEKPNRGPFWALLAVSGLPFIVALYFFYNPEMVAGLSKQNKGTLIQPTRELPQMQLQTIEGKTLDTASLQGNWTLLMVADSTCDDNCMRNLFHLRQIRLAMGEDRYRVQRLMLLTDSTETASLADKIKEFEGTQVITGSTSQREQLLALLKTDQQPLANRVFMIDPRNNLILSYPPTPPWEDVIKDLQLLLKVVQL